MRKKIIILGATGSIGRGTLDVVRKNRDKFEISAITAHTNLEELISISYEFDIPVLVLSGVESNNSQIKYSGNDSILTMLKNTEADIVVNGIAGSDGLEPSIISLQNGKNLALANKETIVMAGKLIVNLAKSHGRKILPVDSEHSAIFHLLENRDLKTVKEIILTASGGPFRQTPLKDFTKITLQEALKHPTWEMGKKITIDSATMANKGLEVIEAHGLFSLPEDKIKVLIHPESRVHSLIRTTDNSMFAQISNPDMKVPIGNALFYPDLMESTFGDLNLAEKSLTFYEADYKRYPLLKYAYETIKYGKSYSIAYNASNEISVGYFLKNQIKFTDISNIVSNILEKNWSAEPESFEEIIEIDQIVRKSTKNFIEKRIRK
ncbi:MAG: 1-deoxy-D-xylulose-5-phosphate reductoisomerase [Spirochaetia bacterium]|jgi:1-deoxy-D-xylulose-5-phosphate reductoisomerase|nr:1-deoxy-D-xylulose-5-phosphate reductoisomerase [Spirochaetia bacterium]